jgi:general secretion pathway protein G
MRRENVRSIGIIFLVVLGVLLVAAIAMPRFDHHGEARPTAARADVAAIGTALEAFHQDTGYFPKGSNGLVELVGQVQGATNWHGPYVKEIGKDPWGNNYIYECPGRHNPNGYDLLSSGPDGHQGTEDDIASWTLKK